MRDNDTILLEELYSEVLKEGKISNALKMGALGAASLMSPNMDASEPEQNKMYYYTDDIVPNDKFVQLWGTFYQTSNDSSKIKRAYDALNTDYKIPMDAKQAIKTASSIFGGDMGVDQYTLIDVLIKTGQVESAYKTKVQYGGGPARGYWQVEPETAMDLLKNSSPLFGKKFQSKFQKYNLPDILRKGDYQTLERLIERDDELAASFAAAKWIATANKYLKQY